MTSMAWTLRSARAAVGRRASAWWAVALVPLLVALLDPTGLWPLLVFAASAWLQTAPYILFAVVLLAALKASGAERMVAEAFQGRESRMIVLAALIGGLAPFCSCEVIPFIAGLLALGAPLSAVMAFWLSSPLIDPPTVLITAAALGWPYAVGKALAAVSLGLAGGLAMHLATRAGLFASPLRQRSGGCGCGPSPFSGTPVWTFWREPARRTVFADTFVENLLFLAKWLLLAYLLEAVLVGYVPAAWIGSVVGGSGAGSVVIGALVGAPAYLNSYAAPALVAGLVEQGMSAGAAMAFLVAGAVSSLPAMVAVWSLVRAPVFGAYLGFGILGAIVVGLLFGLVV